MESTYKNPQGYSDFFTSGLRAMTGRARRPNRRTNANSVDLTLTQNRSSFWTDEYFEFGHGNNPFSNRRHMSLIIGSTVKDNHNTPCTPNTKKRRRSALSSFSTRLLARMSPKGPQSSPSSILPQTHDEDDHALYADDEKEQSSFSIDTPSLPSLHQSSPPLRPIHTFSYSHSTAFELPPSSSSSDFTKFKIERRKRESFLSMNSSSSTLSSLIFPDVPWTFTGAARNGPLTPSPYAQSSSSWNLDEEEEEEEGDGEEAEREVEEPEAEEDEGVSLPMEASYSSEDRETCDWDAPARIDWRQFHVHLL